MRQFVYETEDDENSESAGLKKISEEIFDSKIIYRKQKPLKVLNNLKKVRVENIKLKKTSVAHIIK